MQANSLLELRKFVAPEFVFGQGAVQLAGRYARNLGMERVLLVTDPGVMEAGWADVVRDSLVQDQLPVTTFHDVSPNPRDHEVMAGVEVYRENKCDGIVCVGGGSPMDCAKGIGIAHTNERDILSFEGVDQVAVPGPPLVCIPTTSGTAADISQFAIIGDTARKVKIAIVSKTVIPDASLLDPVLTTTMDRDLTVHTGLDALTHAIEAYVSNASSVITDLFAMQAMHLVREHLAPAADQPQDLMRRAGMLLASHYAGLAFSNAILGAVHAMAHSLGGLMDLPHGQCNAILLDWVMDYNFDSAPDRYVDVGRALGADIDRGAPVAEKKELALQAVRSLKRELSVTACLGDLGVTADDLEALAEKAVNDPCMATNPKHPVSTEDIKAVYERARQG